jgi:hypothetical protein
MPMVPAGFIHQARITEAINDAAQKLRPDEVWHVAFSIGTDSTDEPALFFRIILTDAASREDRLADVTSRVTATLFDSLHPIENWGLTPYFSFRSLSEHRQLNDPVWS